MVFNCKRAVYKKSGQIGFSVGSIICVLYDISIYYIYTSVEAFFSKNTSNGLYKVVSTSSCPRVLMCPGILNDVRSFEDPHIYIYIYSIYIFRKET